MHPIVHSSTVHSSQDVETAEVSVSMGVGQGGVGHAHSHKEEQNNAVCGNMDGPRDCHTAWSTADTERQIPYNIAHVWDRKRAQANLFTRQSRVSNVESKHG